MVTEQKFIIAEVKKRVQKELQGETTGHDWWHAYRVWKMAKRIAREERLVADTFVIELAALLHDIADWKFYKGDGQASKIKEILLEHSINRKIIKKIIDIVENISFKGARVTSKMESNEGKIVQDADRLDALGAIGIVRAFAYGGYKHSSIYDPEKKPILHKTFEEYKRGTSTINHFYEKLLLLKDRMNTKTAKKIAEARHRFMEKFLKRFFQEWNI